MHSRSTGRFMILLCALLILVSVGGVSALWVFNRGPVDEQSDSMGIGLSEFHWQPEEILPNDTPGENYLVLFESILNNNKGGLNSGKDTLEDAVLRHGFVHSSQNVQGGNLKHLFITTASRELDFVVNYVSDEEFHVYMFENDDVEAGQVDVTRIKVYRAIMIYENEEWGAQEVQLGFAVLRDIPDSEFIAIDPIEWQKGPLPST